MASSISAKVLVKDVLLSDQSDWEDWYETIKGAIPETLWKYLTLTALPSFLSL